MAILWNELLQTITLTTQNSSYQMKVDGHGVLLHTYYGSRIENQDMSYLIRKQDRGFSGNPYDADLDRTYSLDLFPQEYSCYGSGDYRTAAIKIRHEDGCSVLDLRYVSHTIEDGKYSLPGLPAIYGEENAQTLKVVLKDITAEIYVTLYYGVMEGLDMITRAVKVENKGSGKIFLESVQSACVDFMHGSYDFISFYGKHAMEREKSRMPVHHGIQSVGSTRGGSSHHYNPFIILAEQGTTESTGNCYGFSLLYSGDFLGAAEHDQINQTRIIMGIHPDNFCFVLENGEEFYSPEAALSFSGQGLCALSQQYHKAYRSHLCRGKYKTARRPVLINNWEGTYFNFTGEKLIAIAKEAEELGVELFVMDDGWFGKRDSDFSGLGDWKVNEEKLGCSLREMAEKICENGMKFGIWFEPECVSEDSDLYRAHPDWAISVPGRKPNRSRYQLILDFSRQEVRDNIYNQICNILDSAPISYVKWDFNRSISDLHSASLPAERQGETAHRYVLGLYEVLEKLITKYPDILWEGCSGGGGRFDAGMLYYTPQIWCSDDTDAIERIKIQYGTSFGYPVSSQGAHVSACPNHQTGRVTPLSTRGTVAMAGTFGYELDVNQMTEEDREEIKQQIAEFKENYSLIQDGDYYRLTDPYQDLAYAVWEYAAEDASRALISIVNTKAYANQAPVTIKIRGLKEDKWYTLNQGKEYYLGSALMKAGILLPYTQYEYQSWNWILEEHDPNAYCE